jgi:hypothetical protein
MSLTSFSLSTSPFPITNSANVTAVWNHPFNCSSKFLYSRSRLQSGLPSNRFPTAAKCLLFHTFWGTNNFLLNEFRGLTLLNLTILRMWRRSWDCVPQCHTISRLDHGDVLKWAQGEAVAQTVVGGFPQQRPGFEPRISSYAICGLQSGARAGFLRVLRFHLPIIHSTNCSTITTL